MGLIQKATKGIAWTGIGQIITQGFQFVIKIILARLLVPEDFGILGMALIFTALVQTVNEFGLSAAIIQKKEIKERHLATSFWISIVIGIILCIVTIICSPLIARFFKKELIGPVISVLSIGFIFGSFGIVHRTLLRKKLNFKSLAIIGIGTAIFSGVISITLALLKFGVWSLVFGSLTGTLIGSILAWIKCSWRPSKKIDFQSFKELFNFGKNVMGSRIINYFSSNTDYLLIGKFLSATSLGFYTLAYQMAIFPLSKISSIIGAPAFPVFSIIQDKNEKLRWGYLKIIKYTSLITFPLLAGLAIVAPRLIPIVIGEKWAPMILPLQILCIAGALKSIGTHIGSILYSKNRSDISFKWNIFATVVTVIAILIGIQYGIVGVATAIAITSCFLFLIIQKITNKLIDLSFRDFFRALYSATICSAIMIVSILLFQKSSLYISLPDILSLVMSIMMASIIYIFAIRIIDKDSLKEIKTLIKQLRNK